MFYTRLCAIGFICFLPFLVCGQLCVPLDLHHSDFTILRNGDLMIIGEAGVSGELMDVNDHDKQLKCHVLIFSPGGEKTFDEWVSYTYPGRYYSFPDTASKYDCNDDQVMQFDILPRQENKAFVYGAFVGHRDLVHEITIDRKHNLSEHRWVTSSGSGQVWPAYWESLQRSIRKRYGEPFYLKEWEFEEAEGECRAGPFRASNKENGCVVIKQAGGEEEWSVSLDGRIRCGNPLTSTEILQHGTDYYISVVNDYGYESCPGYGKDRIPVLYKLDEGGKVLWKIEYDQLKQVGSALEGVIVTTEKADKDFGRYDLQQKKEFNNEHVDSVITFFHENKAFHFRMSWKDNRLKEDKIRYHRKDGRGYYMEETYHEGQVVSRKRYYPDDRLKSSITFDKEGNVRSETIQNETGRYRETRKYEQDTCVRRIIRNDAGKTTVRVLERDGEEYAYVPERHQLTIRLTSGTGPETHVMVYLNEFSDPIEAIYNDRRRRYELECAPPEFIHRIDIIADSLVPREVWHVPVKAHRHEFMPISIETAPEGWSSYFAGSQLKYYKPVDLKLGILYNRPAADTLVDILLQRMGDLDIVEDSSIFVPTRRSRRFQYNPQETRPRLQRGVDAVVFTGPEEDLIAAAKRVEDSDAFQPGWAIRTEKNEVNVITNELRVVFHPGVSDSAAQRILQRHGFEDTWLLDEHVGTWEYDYNGKPGHGSLPCWVADIRLEWSNPEAWRSIAAGLHEESAVMYVVQKTDVRRRYRRWD